MEKQESQKISENMNIGETIARYPETAEIMIGYGLHCVGCHVNPYESIKEGAMVHGLDEKTIEKMVKEMNKAVAGKEEKDVNLSEPAAQKFRELMEKEGKAGWGLKFTVTPGGCSGHTYEMDFAEKPGKNDKVIEEKGMNIFIEKSIIPQVKGVRIDYTDDLQGSGFKITNPNASATCGCGKSSR